jgi:hypothetical protein
MATGSLAPSLLEGISIGGPNDTDVAAGMRGRIQLGNLTFDRPADSFSTPSVDAPKVGDYARQFQPGFIPLTSAPSSSISGWAFVGLGCLATMVAFAIGYYEQGRDRRKHRRSHRHRRRPSD